jgi:uncharacterized membrane protein (DUF4010 family)
VIDVDIELLQRLAGALGAGLLIGLERGWETRQAEAGSRLAGVRTFGLIGLSGGLAAILSRDFGSGIVIAGFLGLAALLIAGYVVTHSLTRDYGMTTEIAALLTFLLGATAGLGQAWIVASVAVITALLLRLKPTLHAWIEHLSAEELTGALKLLLISLVILPILPDRDLGPLAAINPYKTWLMVVLVAALSFLGYAAIRLLGPRRGVLISAICGGLVSSTAVSASFARRAREAPGLETLLAAAILAACATMYLRILVLIGVLQQALLPTLAVPIGLMACVSFASAWTLWRKQASDPHAIQMELRNPFDLPMALQFGGLLIAVIVLSKLLLLWLGSPGIYVAAAAAGITDVDAISISLAQLVTGSSLTPKTATQGILIAALVNTGVKTLIVVSQGTPRLGKLVIVANLAVVVSGLTASFLI